MRLKAGTPQGNRVKRVLLNGQDITDACAELDTEEGWADVFPHERDENGIVVIKNSETERKHGHVEVEFNPDEGAGDAVQED